MGKIRQPLSVKEGIELMNSLIVGINIQKNVVNFQMGRNLCSDEYGRVGKGWWRGFLRRNGHRIVTQQGEKFAVHQTDWTTFDNIKQMYDVIYDKMVDAKIAAKIDSPVFMNQRGELVDELNRFGLKVDTKLTYPEYCLFANETGCNTSMNKDGHVAGTKYITQQGTQAQ